MKINEIFYSIQGEGEWTGLPNIFIRTTGCNLRCAGSISIEKISNENNIMLSLDIKCPSSNMHKKNCLENIKHLGEKDQLKFVIKHEEDYDYAKKIIKSYKPKCTVFFQPVWNSDPNKLAEWLKRDNLNVRLGLQLHKLIWGDKRGV